VHHSDQGRQDTSLAFGRRCREAGITASMGSVGDADDNAMAESCLATLACELLDRHRLRTRTEARAAVFDYLEGFYTPDGATPAWASSARPTTKEPSGPVRFSPALTCPPERSNSTGR
jgi:transposase InsO family protein